MEYVILLAPDPSTLSSQVNALLREGWTMQGGVSVALYEPEGEESGETWAQAMIKREASQ